MRCVECGSERTPEERGWVTVFAPADAARIHYCPDCMAELLSPAPVAAEPDDDGDGA
jgi:hypothetical protein